MPVVSKMLPSRDRKGASAWLRTVADRAAMLELVYLT